ncbi:YhjD/YihY/BrkB family envelope integrity protein, partial [Neisseria sp. P0014.S004]
PWMMQFLVYWALLTFGPLSLGVGLSVVIGQVQVVGGSEWLRVITTVSFITVLLWGLYRFVPNRFVPASHALVGAAVT